MPENSTAPGEGKIIYSLSTSPDYRYLAVGEHQQVVLYELETYQRHKVFKPEHTTAVMAIAFSHQGNTIAAGDKKGKLVIWDAEQQSVLTSLQAHTEIITSISFSKDDKWIATGSTDHTMKVWNAKSGQLIREFADHQSDVTSISFDKQRDILVSGSADGFIRLWELHTGELVSTLGQGKDWIRDVAFQNDTHLLSAVGDDGLLRVWNTKDTKNIQQIGKRRIMHDWLLALDAHHSYPSLAIGSKNGKVTVTTKFGHYSYQVSCPVNDIAFLTNGPQIKLAIATYGKGLIFLDGKEMKMKTL